MRNNEGDILAVFTALPLAAAMFTVFTGSLAAAAAAFFLVFILTGILPFCRRRENLWILLMTAPATVPVNFMLLMKYQIWTELVPETGLYRLGCLLYMPGLMLILSGIELLLTGLAGRILWPGQISLFIPEPEEDEEGMHDLEKK